MANWFNNIFTKANPVQENIVRSEGETHYTTTNITTVTKAFQTIEVVNRGINLVVDSCADINVDIKQRIQGLVVTSVDIRPGKLDKLLNYLPNEYIDINTFRRNIYMDLLVDGNAFIYFDGAHIYNLPAHSVEIIADKKTFVKGYKYLGDNNLLLPTEVIHIRDNSVNSLYRGKSRLLSAMLSVNALNNLVEYQSNFLAGGTVPGIVLTSENPLNEKTKERIRAQWKRQYNIKTNARNPIILDGGFKVDFLGATTIKELDFESSVDTLEGKILEAIGVPPVLLKSGNNANIRPNISLFYITSVIPLVNKVNYALERFFGYDLKCITSEIEAMKPELRDQANYLSTLVNAGIMTRNEARELIRLPNSTQPFASDLVLPANVAGSNVDPNQGGAPIQDNNGK